MKLLILNTILCTACCAAFADGKILYENNFEKEQVGQAPADFLILDGGFAVRAEGANKALELPGTPLDTFAIQFGPAQSEDVSVSVRIHGKGKGRRYPIFGVGLSGSAGYRLQISPSKKSLDLYKDQHLLKSTPYEWKSGQWTKLRLQIKKSKEGSWTIEGKAWPEGDSEPKPWMVSTTATEAPPAGRPSLFASPFSGEKILFDDVVVSSLQ